MKKLIIMIVVGGIILGAAYYFLIYKPNKNKPTGLELGPITEGSVPGGIIPKSH